MNPYQRIIRNGAVVQEGHINTQEKFDFFKSAVPMAGRRVIDIGCNSGMMTKLAKDSGAKAAHGIDIEFEYIRDAARLWPDCKFSIGTIYRIPIKYDIGIVSAMFHYVSDPLRALGMLARSCDTIIGDFNLHSGDFSEACGVFLDHRGLWIPTRSAFEEMALMYFNRVENLGPAPSPDSSTRYYYILSEPKPSIKTAELIWGVSESGKSTYANERGLVTLCDVLSTDLIFVEWRVIRRGYVMDISALSEAFRGNKKEEYVQFYLDYLERWAKARMTLDIIIEGFELSYDDVRIPLVDMLTDFGWKVDAKQLSPGWWK